MHKKINVKNEDITIQGNVTLTFRDKNKKITDRFTKNLIVTTGKHHIADQLAGMAQAPMSHMAIGSGTTVQDITDTQLVTEISRKPFTDKSQGTGGDANKVIIIADWPSGEGDGAISEAGIFNAASGGTMLCRTTFPVKNKGAGDSLTATWTITVN